MLLHIHIRYVPTVHNKELQVKFTKFEYRRVAGGGGLVVVSALVWWVVTVLVSVVVSVVVPMGVPVVVSEVVPVAELVVSGVCRRTSIFDCRLLILNCRVFVIEEMVITVLIRREDNFGAGGD
jgi:hypothetical protein